MLKTIQVIQLVIFVAVLMSIGMAIVYIRRKPSQWYYMIPPTAWLAQLLGFYFMVGIRDFTSLSILLDFTLWSAILRLQGVFIIFGILFMLVYERLFFKS